MEKSDPLTGMASGGVIRIFDPGHPTTLRCYFREKYSDEMGTIQQHHIAKLPQIRLVINTQGPGLRHNRVKTGFDWEVFGEEIRKVISELF